MNRPNGLWHLSAALLLLTATAAVAQTGPTNAPPAVAADQSAASDAPDTQAYETQVAQTSEPQAEQQSTPRDIENDPNAESNVIYGQDTRRDYGHSEVSAGQRRAADATALVVFGWAEQFAKHLGRQTIFSMPSRTRFCSPQMMAELRRKGSLPPRYPNEPFSDDRVLSARGSCTAFKVGPDLVATAGHCAGESQSTACPNINFVFNYHKSADKPAPENSISGTDVYQCRAIVARYKKGRRDWAVVRVDRVIDAPQVRIRTASMPRLRESEGVTLIGHPAGLPLKVASGGRVLRFQEDNFRANIDAYGGNSGSPIFNTEALARGDLLVEGVLQGGSDDYVDWCNHPSRDRITSTAQNRCSCAVSYRCSFSAEAGKACGGEIGVYARFLGAAFGSRPGTAKRPDASTPR